MRYPDPNSETLNPWTSIWFKPRKTIQWIVDTRMDYGFWHIIVLYGILAMLSVMEDLQVGESLDSLSMIIVCAFIFGPALTFVMLSAVSKLTRFYAGRMGGHATYNHVRVAILWSYPALIPAYLFMIPRIMTFGHSLFTPAHLENGFESLSSDEISLEVMYALATVAGAIWGCIIGAKTLGQVEGFSAWRGFCALVVSALTLMLVIMIPVMIYFISAGIY